MSERSSAGSMRFARTVAPFLFGLVVWLAHFEPPSGVPGPGLDAGWLAAMGHFLVDGAHAGTDWIFTAGPLAGLHSAYYQPELFWWKLLAWEGAWRLCTVACLVLATLRIESRLERALCGLFLVFATLYFDPWALATLVAGAVLLDDAGRPPRPLVEWIVLVAIGGAALAKFTILVAAVVLFAALAVARGARRGRAAGIALAAKALAVTAALWFLAGQRLSDVWPYLSNTWQIASNYSEAQSTPPHETSWLVLGLVGVAALVLSLALWTRSGVAPWARLATALGLAFVVFCAWKTGFVRADDHPTFYFAFAPLAALMLPSPQVASPRARAGVRALRLAAFAVGCAGSLLTGPSDGAAYLRELARAPVRAGQNLAILSDPRAHRRGLEEQLAEQRERYPFPEVRARVGTESIDFLGFQQGLLLLHGLDWTPRPAFQGYITFTPELQQRNADFLAGPRAPRYLLSRFESIDGRWPAMDDALALEIVSRGYAPVLQEREYLLLERRDAPLRDVRRTTVLERELRFGEPLVLPPAGPDAAQLLTLDLRPTAAGWLARLLESMPALTMRLTLDDGTTRTGRVVPSMMRSRVLVDPVVETADEWTDWMLGRALQRCVALTIEAPAGGAWRFQPAFAVRLERAEGLQPERRAGLEPASWMLGVLPTAPEKVYTARTPSRTTVDGHPVAVVHAPSRMTWRLAPGKYRLRVRYGVLPDPGKRDAAAAGEFLVLETGPGTVHTHLRRAFSPDADLSRQGPQTFEATFESAGRGNLVLATTAGPGWAGSGALGVEAGCYWSEMSLERVADGGN